MEASGEIPIKSSQNLSQQNRKYVFLGSCISLKAIWMDCRSVTLTYLSTLSEPLIFQPTTSSHGHVIEKCLHYLLNDKRHMTSIKYIHKMVVGVPDVKFFIVKQYPHESLVYLTKYHLP